MTRSDPAVRPIALEHREGGLDGRLFSPSAARNSGPISRVLADVLPESGNALEIGSGTGEHIACFAKALPGIVWHPSDPDQASRTSIAAWTAAEGLTNVRAPAAIDVREAVWGLEGDGPFDVVISLNMIHIAPWDAALGLIAGASRLLKPGGLFFLYGPFMRDGAHTAPSNAAFDADLKRRDIRWGVRDIGDISAEAGLHGLELRQIVEMPANNLSLIFDKTG